MPWWTRIGILLCVAFGCWILLGCSSTVGEESNAPGSEFEAGNTPSAEELYGRALTAFEEGRYQDAIEAFQLVEQEYPASEWAKRAQIMAGYSAYRDESYDEAAIILERFVKLHPNNPSTPYAFYLRALTFYEQIVDVGRDQQTTQRARQALREVVSRFPETDYARDAAIKLELTEDHLAGKEMEIGRYYLERDEYLAAIGRFQYVVDAYQTTSHAAEALHRLVEAYLSLGVRPEAEKYAAVLGHNYPGSEWYQYSYRLLHGEDDPKAKKTDAGWFGRLTPEL